MQDIISYLKDSLPKDKKDSTKTANKRNQIHTKGDILYKQEYTYPLLRCISEDEALYVITKIYECVCVKQASRHFIVQKALK